MDPTIRYPMPKVGNQIAYLKNVITRPGIEVGDYTYYHDYRGADRFQEHNVLYLEPVLGDKLIIGKFCQIAMGATFIMNASTHDISGFSSYPFPVFAEEWTHYPYEFPFYGDTVVGNDVWFGHDVLINPGVKIGDGAIIATRALVTKDVPPYTIVGGTPARTIRERFSKETVDRLLEIRWWDWPIEKITANLAAITGTDLASLESPS